MNEVSNVSALISRLIAFAIALGAAGTLMDSVLQSKGDAKNALANQQLSYSKWNATLLKR